MMNVEAITSEPQKKVEEEAPPALAQNQQYSTNSRSESPDQKPSSYERYLKKGTSPTVRNQKNLSEWIKERQRKIQESKKSSEVSVPMFTTATTSSFETGQEKAEKRYQEQVEEDRIDLQPAAQNEENVSDNDDIGEGEGDGQLSRVSNTIPETK